MVCEAVVVTTVVLLGKPLRADLESNNHQPRLMAGVQGRHRARDAMASVE